MGPTVIAWMLHCLHLQAMGLERTLLLVVGWMQEDALAYGLLQSLGDLAVVFCAPQHQKLSLFRMLLNHLESVAVAKTAIVD